MNIKYNRLKSILLFASLSLGTLTTFAQSDVVKGIVYNDAHQVVLGAVVKVVGTDLMTVTDRNGCFEISGVVASDQELVVEYVGYRTTSELIKADGKSVAVYLSKDIARANQKVSMVRDSDREAYTIGASQYTITGDELRKSHRTNIASALAGRVPGLFVGTSSSEPGKESYSLSIRGTSSTSSDSPLILVDGMVSDLSIVNINDVESVTVMKDAASTALYGMQSSGGIISVKTRRGENNSPSIISVDANYTFQQALKTPTILSSGDYTSLINQAWKNDGYGDNYIYSNEQIANYASGKNLDLYPNNNWYDMFLKEQVKTFNLHANAYGGGDYVKYYVSLAYTNQESPYITDSPIKEYKADRFSARSNIDVKINNFINGYINMHAMLDNEIIPQDNDEIFSSIFDLPSTSYGPLTPDGFVIVTPEKTDPVYGSLNRSGYSNPSTLYISTDIGLNFDLDFFLKGLSVNANYKNYTYDYSVTNGNTDYARYTRDLTVADDLVFYQYGSTEDEPLSFSKSSDVTMRNDLEANVNYERVFGDHYIRANAFIDKYCNNTSGLQGNLPEYRMSYGLQATYGYKNILFADILTGYQGSEQFAEGKRYGFFPAASVAALLSNMDFLKDNKAITYLKARASYGVVGDDSFDGDRFMYNDILSDGGNNLSSYIGTAISITRLGNPDLTWEKIATLNVGFDMTILDEVTVSLDYFNERRTDMLVTDNLSPLIGGTSSDVLPMINNGEIVNRGFDLGLAYNRNIGQDFNIGLNSYISFYKNKVVNVDELPYSDSYATTYRETGYRVNQNFGYEIDYSNGNGYFNSQQELDTSGLIYDGTAPRVGDFIYIDQNSDGVINQEDVVAMGETTDPQISWGAELFFRAKQFDLSVLFQGLGKFGTFNSGIGYYENTNNGTYFSQHLNAWTQERYESGQTIDAPALTMMGSSSQKSNNYYYQDKSFGRIKNIELGYTVPKLATQKINIDRLRIYASAMNVFTWDNMKTDDTDVEGGAVNAFPTLRYYTVGLNLTF